jgi:hypothetical protein
MSGELHKRAILTGDCFDPFDASPGLPGRSDPGSDARGFAARWVGL